MANWMIPLWEGINASMKQGLPDLTTAFRVTQVQRVHWLNRITDGTLTAPWGIVQIPARVPQEPGHGGAVVFRVPVQVFYVCRQGAEDNVDAGAFVEGKLLAYQDALVGYSWGFTIPDNCFALDVSDTNPAAQIFLEGRLPYFAGSLSFDAIIGYVT